MKGLGKKFDIIGRTFSSWLLFYLSSFSASFWVCIYTCIHCTLCIQLDKVGIRDGKCGICNFEEQYKPACLVRLLLGQPDFSYRTNSGLCPLRVWAVSSDLGVGTVRSTVLPTSASQSHMNSPTPGDPIPGLYWGAFKEYHQEDCSSVKSRWPDSQ